MNTRVPNGEETKRYSFSTLSLIFIYDKVSRMVRTKNRKASIITVKRFKCPVCNCIHRNLPNNIFPYKQYDARIITGVIEGKITSDMIDYEDYPCEMTMTRWRTLNLQSLL